MYYYLEKKCSLVGVVLKNSLSSITVSQSNELHRIKILRKSA